MILPQNAWDALRDVGDLVTRVEAGNEIMIALATDVRELRERVVALEAVIAFVRARSPDALPGGDLPAA